MKQGLIIILKEEGEILNYKLVKHNIQFSYIGIQYMNEYVDLNSELYKYANEEQLKSLEDNSKKGVQKIVNKYSKSLLDSREVIKGIDLEDQAISISEIYGDTIDLKRLKEMLLIGFERVLNVEFKIKKNLTDLLVKSGEIKQNFKL